LWSDCLAKWPEPPRRLVDHGERAMRKAMMIALAAMAVPGRADVIFDQINPAFTQAAASQEQSGSAFTLTLKDDFTFTSAAPLQSVKF
jgi:hypothetical protein